MTNVAILGGGKIGEALLSGLLRGTSTSLTCWSSWRSTPNGPRS